MFKSFALLSAVLPIAGCVNPGFLHDDRAYPPEWPPVVPLQAQCEALSGTYRNAGTVVHTDGKRGSGLLSDLAFGSRVSKLDYAATETVSVTVTRQDRGWRTRFHVRLADPRADRVALDLSGCRCSEAALTCTMDRRAAGVPLYMFEYARRRVDFAEASDRTLVVRAGDLDFITIFVFPVAFGGTEWGRFTSATAR